MQAVWYVPTTIVGAVILVSHARSWTASPRAQYEFES